MNTYEELNKLLEDNENDSHVFITKNQLSALELVYGSYTIDYDDIKVEVYNYENLVRPIIKVSKGNKDIWVIKRK